MCLPQLLLVPRSSLFELVAVGISLDKTGVLRKRVPSHWGSVDLSKSVSSVPLHTGVKRHHVPLPAPSEDMERRSFIFIYRLV